MNPAVVLLLALGLALALSPLAGGYYDSSIWAPAGLGVLVVLTALLLAQTGRPSRRAVAAVALLALLGFWSLLSAAWADSIQQAVVEGNRLLVYAAVLGVAISLVTDEKSAIWLLAAIGSGAAVIGAIVVARAIDGNTSLLLSGRLNEPLGYVNGQASLFVVAVWPALALAEQRRSVILAGVGLGVTTLMIALVTLAQSRGAVLALAVSSLVVLAGVPGRRRRLTALFVAAGCVGAAASTLLHVYDAAASRDALGDALSDAGLLALLVSVAAGVAWGSILHARRALVMSRPALVQRLYRVWVAGLVLLAISASAVAVGSAGRISDYLDRQYDGFVSLDDPTPNTGGSRLVAGAGNRYDYWRIAVDAWRGDPIVGTGAGGYDVPYFAERSTAEDIRQPHSLVLQTLSETGLVGALLLAAFLVTAGTAFRRLTRDAMASSARAPTAVAATGVFVAWLVHTSVDWMHLLPGLTGIALCALAIALREPRSTKATASGLRRLGLVSGLAVSFGVAAFSVGRQALSEHYRDSASGALASDPRRALEDANRALRFDREDVSSYYVKAAALARFGKAPESRAVLLDAARREPRDFVTWALLGDLAVRRGELAEARGHYSRALHLNPRDRTLRVLSQNPAIALSQSAAR